MQTGSAIMLKDLLTQPNSTIATPNTRLFRMEAISTGPATVSGDNARQNDRLLKAQRRDQDRIKLLTNERDSARKASDRQKREILKLRAKVNENGTQLLRAEADLRTMCDKPEQSRSLLEASSAGVNAAKDTAFGTSQQI